MYSEKSEKTGIPDCEKLSSENKKWFWFLKLAPTKYTKTIHVVQVTKHDFYFVGLCIQNNI